MLQKQSVRTELLELLVCLMQQDEFQDFVLVGGTALALQIGHRNSVNWEEIKRTIRQLQ